MARALRALILAGGLGTRLRPLTNDIPKCLVPVGDKPIIDHVIQLMRRHGIKEIGVNTHYLADKVRDHLKDTVTYQHEPKLLGTAGTINAWLPWLGKDFLVMNADTLTDIDLTDFIEYHFKWNEIATVSRNRMNDHCTGAMVFNRRIKSHLAETGMIDDIFEDLLTSNYYKCPNYFDCGTPEKLQKAREWYEANSKVR